MTPRRRACLVVLVWLAAMTLAFQLRWVQDDAFISFRYAAHWAGGHGPVWEPGSPVEGYTNFLWTALIAGALALGWAAEPASIALGLACYGVTLLLAERLARRWAGPDAGGRAGLVCLLLLAGNYSVAIYATGGLETPLVTLLAVALLSLVDSDDPPGPGRALAISVVSALALMTRLDAALLVAPAGGWALARSLRRGAWPVVAALLLPAAGLVGGWLAWKLQLYGELLPNTYHAKLASGDGARRAELARRYLGGFLSAYGLWYAPLLLLWGWWSARAERWWGSASVVLAYLVLLVLYMARTGGGFMEYRLLVPGVVLGGVLLAVVFVRQLPPALVVILLLATTAASAWHGRYFVATRNWAIGGNVLLNSQRYLRWQVEGPRGWIAVGRALREAFPGGDVRIAVSCAGAIPYHARLPTVDMLGLNDRWIARHGTRLPLQRPGHQRVTTIAYLEQRQVQLLIGVPWLLPTDDDGPWTVERLRRWLPLGDIVDVDRLRGRRLALIPLTPDRVFPAILLTPSPAVDAAIRDRGWRTATVE